MEFSNFFDLIISAFSPSDTKHEFLSKLFASAGLSLNYSKSAKKKFYSGDRHFSMDFKRECRQDFNTDSAASFFQELCVRCDQHHIIAKLGLPESGQLNTDALSIALAQQFKRIIDSDAPNFDNILSQAYLENCAKKISGEPPAEIQPPHYPGDDFFIPTRHVSKNAGCYETFQHAWEIVTQGRRHGKADASTFAKAIPPHPRWYVSTKRASGSPKPSPAKNKKSPRIWRHAAKKENQNMNG